MNTGINGSLYGSLPIVRQVVTCVEVLVEELCGLGRVPSRWADLPVLLQQVLLQPRLAARLPSQSGEQPPTAHGNMYGQERRQLLPSVESRGGKFESASFLCKCGVKITFNYVQIIYQNVLLFTRLLVFHNALVALYVRFTGCKMKKTTNCINARRSCATV